MWSFCRDIRHMFISGFLHDKHREAQDKINKTCDIIVLMKYTSKAIFNLSYYQVLILCSLGLKWCLLIPLIYFTKVAHALMLLAVFGDK